MADTHRRPTHLRDLFGRGAIYSVATAVQLLAGVLMLPFLTRLLSTEEFGLVATAVVVAQVTRIVCVMGLSTAVTLAYYRDEGLHASRRLAALTVSVAFVVAGMIHLLGPVWSGVFSGQDYGAALSLAVWTAVPFGAMFVAQAIMRVRHQALLFSTTAALGFVLSQALGIIFLLMLDRTAVAYLAGVFLGFTVAGIFGAVATRFAVPVVGRDLLSWSARVSLPTVPHSLALIILQAGDRIIIERIDGIEAVGRYQIAYLIGAVGLTLVSALNNAWSPIIYEAAEPERWTILSETTGAVLRLTGLLAAGIAVAAPFALAVAAPADYDRADLVPVVAIVAFAVVPFVGYLARVHILFSRGHTAPLMWVTPMAAAANLAMNAVFVRLWSLGGAAVATVLAYALQAFLVGVVGRGLTRVDWPRREMVAASLVGLGGVAVGIMLGAGTIALLVRGLLLAGLVVGVVVSLRSLLGSIAGESGRPPTQTNRA